jgi:DNA repair protein RecN (Recombination protein N)
MPNTCFSVAFSTRTDPGGLIFAGNPLPLRFDEFGTDIIEFTISPNRGEDPRPLARVASGGELARIMLALKSVIAEADATPVLIFDELDQGVGGRLGHVIGEKLCHLSHSHQVICITHLPQVAAYADAHYTVAKTEADERTITTVRLLDQHEQIEELAAMLAGERAGPAAHRSASELLTRATEWKLHSTNRPGPD